MPPEQWPDDIIELGPGPAVDPDAWRWAPTARPDETDCPRPAPHWRLARREPFHPDDYGPIGGGEDPDELARRYEEQELTEVGIVPGGHRVDR